MQDKDTCQGEKKPYVKPQLKTHGKVAELTQHPGNKDKGDKEKGGGPGSHLFS